MFSISSISIPQSSHSIPRASAWVAISSFAFCRSAAISVSHLTCRSLRLCCCHRHQDSIAPCKFSWYLASSSLCFLVNLHPAEFASRRPCSASWWCWKNATPKNNHKDLYGSSVSLWCWKTPPKKKPQRLLWLRLIRNHTKRKKNIVCLHMCLCRW